MDKWPTVCFAGRVIMGGAGLDSALEWEQPCPIPPENIVHTTVPLFFCVRHYDAVMEHLYGMFTRLGMIDESIVGEVPDEFDRIVARLRDQAQ